MRISMSGLGQDLGSDVIAQLNANGCVVGGIDPTTGDTIASCGGVTSSTPALVPIVQNGVTVGYSPSGSLPAASSSTGLYLGIAAVALVVFMAMGKR